MWDTQNRKAESFSGKGSGWLIGHEKGMKEAKQISRKEHPEYWDDKEIESAFCQLCGAWRGSLGLEPTFQLYIQHLIQIFDEVKRVLRPDGTCWVNLGDSYGSGKGERTDNNPKHIVQHRRNFLPGMQKSLCQIPSRFAIAMTDAGWILRNELIWHKRNCMPSSAKDRFTVDWESVFFFVKNKKYWFERQMVPLAESTSTDHRIANEDFIDRRPKRDYPGSLQLGGGMLKPYGDMRNKRCVWDINLFNVMKEIIESGETSEIKTIAIQELLSDIGDKGSLWDITTKPFKGAHFAVFPPKLVEPMIKAGCPEQGIVLDPFAGSGTTCAEAKRLNRQYIGFDLNAEYVTEIAEKKLAKTYYQHEMDIK